MDRKTEKSSGTSKPVPMKLFAAWEVDRTPPNCVPRLCSLKITRLSLMTPLPPDLTSLSLAVKMQSSKRTLRSHEIPVPQIITPQGGGGNFAGLQQQQQQVLQSNGIGAELRSPPFFETDLDLHFSLQYPHFLKRDGNRLLILLQRRKKYKSRTILGYKTLAEGVIRMDYVLQKSVDMTVELIASGKAGRQGLSLATVRATQVSSIPVDADNKNNNSVVVALQNDYSDEDEEPDFSSNEDNDDRLDRYKRSYNGKRSNYCKMGLSQGDGDADDGNLAKNEGDSDSELDNFGSERKKGGRAKFNRRNFKQKIVALLKRFKVPDELEGDTGGRGHATLGGERDLDALFQELESLSCGEESGQDIDSISIGSTPKPSLRPFFTSSRQVLHDNTADRSGEWKNDSSGNEGAPSTDPDIPNATQQSEQIAASPPKDSKEGGGDRRSRLFRTSSSTPSNKKKQSLSFSISSNDQQQTLQQQISSASSQFPQMKSNAMLDACLSPTNVEPRKTLLDQLAKIFNMEISILPDVVVLVGPQEAHGGGILSPKVSELLSRTFKVTFSPQNTAEIKAILTALMNKIQKYCNSNAKPPNTIKVVLVGGDWLQGAVLRHYVDLLGVRPPDWANHIRYYIVPIGSCAIARYLSSIDTTYGSLFGTEVWQQLCERIATLDATDTKNDGIEITNRLHKYIYCSGPCTQVPIAEAMVNYKDEDSCQIFVPFISDVKLTCIDPNVLSLDMDESLSTSISQTGTQTASGSPPQSGRNSPPMPSTPSSANNTQEAVELQIDYWPIARPIIEGREKGQTKDKDQGKNSIKSTFRNLQVWRLPPYPLTGEISSGLTLSYSTKEKKQKIMRLGKKKEKDRDMEKEQLVDGVARLICSPKSHQAPLRVYIDGTEWTGVKFFQLSSQWQTHVRNFPIALIGTATTMVEE
ncbi:phosphofurin acidic cluster sorting protein 2 isoform X2 [Culicoides brevitarsis]|uniref:phosphofurin acidic cluster sorting protein 2 isoform X2 n=1 Tax=Culicoides brevitarsis TaxID=469753 RepID=UPI00307C2C66